MPSSLLAPTNGPFTLRQVYVTALVMLGVLSVLSNVLLSAQLRATRTTAMLITAAAQQRTLAGRIAADAQDAASTDDPRAVADLRVSLHDFQAWHARLAGGDRALYRSGFPDALRAYYRTAVTPLVTTFSAAADRVALNPTTLRADSADVAVLTTLVRGDLDTALARAVVLTQGSSENVVTQVQWLSWARVGLVLTLLAALGVFVFRPLERRNRALMLSLTRERNAAARLAAAAETGRDHAVLLADLNRSFGSAHDLQDLTRATHALIGPALACTTVGLVQRGVHAGDLPLHGPDVADLAPTLDPGGTVQRALAAKPADHVVVMDDPALRRLGMHAGLAPLPDRPGRAPVALLLARTEPTSDPDRDRSAWTPEQQTLALAAASALCAAWERVQLYEELRRRDAYTQALLEVSALTEGSREPGDVAAATVAIIAQVTRIDAAELAIDQPGDHTRVPLTFTDHLPPAYGSVHEEAVTLCQVPLGHAGDRAYTLHLSRRDGLAWRPADHALFTAAARSVGVALARQAHLHGVEQAALSDALTGLPNRRAFERDLDALLNAARHGDGGCAVIMIDLDGLKGINDRHGHAAGDALLRAFGHALPGAFRPGDVAYRLGGDEYAVLLPHAHPDGRERLLAQVEHAAAATRAAGYPDTGASAGIAFCTQDGLTATELVRLADERMYEDKHDRRLRCAAKPPADVHPRVAPEPVR